LDAVLLGYCGSVEVSAYTITKKITKRRC